MKLPSSQAHAVEHELFLFLFRPPTPPVYVLPLNMIHERIPKALKRQNLTIKIVLRLC